MSFYGIGLWIHESEEAQGGWRIGIRAFERLLHCDGMSLQGILYQGAVWERVVMKR